VARVDDQVANRPALIVEVQVMDAAEIAVGRVDREPEELVDSV